MATARADVISKGLLRRRRNRPVIRSVASAHGIWRRAELAGARSIGMLGSTFYLEYTGRIAATKELYTLFAFFLQIRYKAWSAATHSLVDSDVMIVQNAADGAFQGGSRFEIRTFGDHHGGPCLRQIALILNDEEGG